jgi:hypothetical protein
MLGSTVPGVDAFHSARGGRSGVEEFRAGITESDGRYES